MADDRKKFERDIAERMGGSAAAKLYDKQVSERENRRDFKYFQAKLDAAKRSSRSDLIREAEADKAAYNKVQGWREQDVEDAAKDAGYTGDPYDRNAPFKSRGKGYAAGGPAKGQMPPQMPKPAPRAAEKEEDYMPSPEKRKEMEDMIREQRMRRAGDTAPTTRTEMGKRFAAGGGVTRGDGCAQRGRTKGRMI